MSRPARKRPGGVDKPRPSSSLELSERAELVCARNASNLNELDRSQVGSSCARPGSCSNQNKAAPCRLNLAPNQLQAMTLAISQSISILILTLLAQTQLTIQQQNPFCPKSCTCDEQSLEILCREPIGTSGIPHTLNPGTTKIVINNAQTTQLTGLEVFVKLEHLDLSRNKLSLIDFREISKAPHLKFLNTSHNYITDLKDTLVANALTSFQPPLSAALWLHEQETSEFVDSLKRLTKINIISFFLSHNEITTIANLTFIRWHRLQRLDLSYNVITFLDILSLAGLGKLEYLNLRGNRLKQVPTVALQNTVITLPVPSTYLGPLSLKPPSLKTLDLGENIITHLESNSFSALEKVQELHLDFCLIGQINNDAFRGLHMLTTLILDGNMLQKIPSNSFPDLGVLRTLKINSNRIDSIPSYAFAELINLEELQINYGLFNKLVKDVFHGLHNLRLLEVTFNQNLSKIHKGVFEDLYKLKILNLNSNALTNLPDDLSKKGLELLDLRNNSLHCDCDLKWLTRWLKSLNESSTSISKRLMDNSGISSASQIAVTYNNPLYSLMNENLLNLTCAGPPAIAGRRVQELPDNKLECLEPNSYVNVHIGFGLLFAVASIMTLVCLINFCKEKKHLMATVKDSIVQGNISIMLPYRHNIHKNVEDLKKETQFYGSDYESISYSNPPQQTSNYNDQILYCGTQHPYFSQHI